MRTRRIVPRALAVAVILLALVAAVPVPGSADTRKDATWSEAYFASGDGLTQLHADILRPKGMPLDAAHKTPVILTVSPYTNHSGQTTDFNPQAAGPSSRFYDFLDLSRALERGYTYVIVDLPGFGGSGGCNDWGGAREQGAVKAAVQWAASQPWSTGKVGMFGKSYDGWTGLMGIAQHPKGLAAVISLEPVYTGYGYEYMNGVRMSTSAAEGALFAGIDAKPGSLNDSPQYHANGAPEAWCYGVNVAMQQQDDPNSAFWQERNLIKEAKGSTVPLFLTQGFLEDNTKPDQALTFWSGMKGPKRAWFGQWDHCRPWETYGVCKTTSSTAMALGRPPSIFIDEALRFFDTYLKGGPAATDPPIEVQDNTGSFRAEQQYPPADDTTYTSTLKTGSYTDDGNNNGTGSGGGQGVWSFSQPLPHQVWMAGEPVLKARVTTTVPRANFVADVYDVAPDGRATLVSRGAQLLRGYGGQYVNLTMYPQDWRFAPGHRIGVLISSSNSEWWVHIPTQTSVSVGAASIGLPFLGRARTRFLVGGPTPRLRDWLATGFVTVTKAAVAHAATTFKLPSH